MQTPTVRTSAGTTPVRLLVLLIALFAMAAATLPTTLTAAHAQESGPLGFELTFTPAAGDEPALIEVVVTHLASGNPAAGLFTDIQAYPFEDTTEEDDGERQRAIISETLPEDGTLSLQVPAAIIEDVQQVDVSVDVFEEPNRVVERGSYFELFTVSEAGQSGTPTLTDVTGTTHENNILELIALRVTSGFPDETYRPEDAVQRGQLATFLSRTLPLDFDPDVEVDLVDVVGTTHEAGILQVVGAGVVSGYADRTYRPDEDVTRAQMATFIARALDLPDAPASAMTDIDGNTHQDAIDRVIAAGIAGGYPDDTYRPGEVVTRGQMATFLIRARDYTFEQLQ